MSAAPGVSAIPIRTELRQHWPLVLAASAGVMVSFASIFIYSFGVLLKPLSAEFGWTRGQVSAGFSIAALTVAFASPFIGRLSDRIGVRPVIVAATAVFGTAFASLSALHGALWQFYAVLFLIGLIGNGTTQLTWARAVTANFDSQRGVALSLMMLGGGTGSMLVPWVTALLVSGAGWRWACAALGGVVVLVGPVLAFAALPRGVRSVGEHRHEADKPGLRNPVFRLLLAAFLLVSLGANGCVAHLAALLTDRGLTAGTAAAAVSILGLASVSGRLITGFLIDRLFAPHVGFWFIAASAAGILLLSFSGTAITAAIAAALVGLAMGAEADIFPYLISRYMGLKSFAELYGYAFSAYAIGGAAGPLLMGLAYDRTTSYTIPLLVGAVATVVAACLMLVLPRYSLSRADNR